MSALPTKYVPIEFSVLGVAATIIAEMRSNDTVSSLWDRLADNPQVRTFDRFAAALTLLFAGSVISLEGGILRRTPILGGQQ
ncbi:hypothetical protein N7E70_021525 [Aminobacter sp. NyZ550]|uniref:ABC-three component system middle component 6 n=1 Tax=Aminobacter sp. NyZ550 TaxID=2979870 RepID=UPI0021D59CC6|nr:ABC-three component system middle component 6 [Aminobacter sp. NyZ550]WAX94231.1 hypothetical protein N7E70_021525 [Aminobacter sp. NyZ550]